ncbi:2-oxo-4-hydroxy-4-carboxy-5-ureidoimidazoline decarboxylase [Nocardia blacklockiae]|uniref:2-oxo-4-hydroxy-4-carboxy-5-ureidoimidazoline decarboxylase n=1 Tax=Nocardia blacklockiae TaxID=480036 RepID=UPI001895C5BF|nr:2-oxo-4-hydroxy-4-carboxy-5-ureidoimidazoline decarboxylase [Nocardia blacklockiae]MBF6173221.1 OHCU decarboxylase [Nocardia blacklockiae]
MLMHNGIGLDNFNSLPRTRAVHALYECCCAVTWAEKVADGRPYPDRAALLAAADVELPALSAADLDRIFDSFVRRELPERTPEALGQAVRERLGHMLGPSDGYPDY